MFACSSNLKIKFSTKFINFVWGLLNNKLSCLKQQRFIFSTIDSTQVYNQGVRLAGHPCPEIFLVQSALQQLVVVSTFSFLKVAAKSLHAGMWTGLVLYRSCNSCFQFISEVLWPCPGGSFTLVLPDLQFLQSSCLLFWAVPWTLEGRNMIQM